MFRMGPWRTVGRFDNESVIYRTDDPEQKVRWRRLGGSYLVGSILATALVTGAGPIVGKGAAIVMLFANSAANGCGARPTHTGHTSRSSHHG